MSLLILLRHGQSQWNLENRFTGWADVPLSELGKEEARRAGAKLKNVQIHEAYTSLLQRAYCTLEIALAAAAQEDIPISKNSALNERHYGDLQGLNKEETVLHFGKEQVHLWRRSYDVAPPNGESLKDTAARTLPYFRQNILSGLQRGKNILIAAHGNSLRSIIMEIEHLSPQEIVAVEIPTGVLIGYEVDVQGKVVAKKLL